MNNSAAVLKKLIDIGVCCSTDVLGRDKTSFKIGGKLGLWAEPDTVDKLCKTLMVIGQAGCRSYIIGNGSNLLISDEGVDAVFIRLSGSLCDFHITGSRLIAYAGASLAAAAKATVSSGLMGLEWAAGIPGTVGGAVAMNAGAYGGEIKDVITSVAVVSGDDIKWVPVKPGDMGYRRSSFAFPESVVVAAEFVLEPDDGGAYSRMAEYNEKRREKQPVELPSAGSTFKRPDGYFAAALIDRAGLKGASAGGACVSTKHAGFIVNTGGASYSDVIELIEFVKKKVYADSGVLLEPEIKIIQ